MKILLINSNPVVSRLLALCTRDVSMVLEEVVNHNTVHDSKYDVVFVDEASYSPSIDELLARLEVQKKVLISYRNNTVIGFDEIIKKPFLPSQIIELLKDVASQKAGGSENPLMESDEVMEEESIPSIFSLEDDVDETVEESSSNPSILDTNEIEKIKSLLEMDEETIVSDIDDLNEDEYEKRKVEVIKEHLLADGIEEIFEEDEIVSSLSDLPDEINLKKKKNKLKKKEKKKKKKNLQLTEDEIMKVEDAIEKVMVKMKKKEMKKLLKGESIALHIKLKGKK